MNELKIKKAFTLVELIIVITILVILATIAFVSFQNYTKDSRDANRLTTINNISKGLDIFQIKTGFYPEPENKTSFTGAGDKKLHQGIISDNITNIINLSEIPFDPKEKTNYIYSTYGDGKYYQIASEAENITSFLYNTTYAENKSSIVRGNYKFDPSLPSLLVIPNSLTGSSIFDPKVCFVTNGGVNSITSDSGNCLKKEEMSLNTIDNSLVGYWDMESLTTDGKLKDLSGNDNHGVCYNNNSLSGSCTTTGPVIYSGGMIFDGTIGKGIRILNSTGMINGGKEMTFVGLMSGYCNNNGNCPIIRGGGLSTDVKSLNYTKGSITGEISINKSTNYYKYLVEGKNIYSNDVLTIGVVTFNGNTLKIYRDGVLKNKYDIHGTISTGSMDYTIGKIVVNDPTNSFSGIIYEIKAYNRALTDQEIAQQARIAGF